MSNCVERLGWFEEGHQPHATDGGIEGLGRHVEVFGRAGAVG
jgi:hypothetical protein